MTEKLSNVISERHWDELVGRIYDAAIDASSWPDVLLAIGEPVRSHGAQLTSVSLDAGKTVDDVVAGPLDARATAEFEELVSLGEQVRVNHAAAVDEFEPIYDYRHTSEAEMRRSLFYQEHAIPLDVAYYAGTVLRKGRESLTGIVHFRSRSRGHFSEGEIAYLMRVAPHVRRCIDMTMQIGERRVTGTAECLLQSLSCAGLVLDEKANVVTANDQGVRLLAARDGLSDPGGRLHISAGLASRALQQELSGVLGGAGTIGLVSGAPILVPRPSGRAALRVLVCPLQRRLEPFLSRYAVALVIDPESTGRVPPRQLAREFGLTPAESGVAALLVDGCSVAAIAELRGCRAETVRSQVKQILAKTGCRRQAEFMLLVLRSSWVRVAPPGPG